MGPAEKAMWGGGAAALRATIIKKMSTPREDREVRMISAQFYLRNCVYQLPCKHFVIRKKLPKGP